jgi:hypothetical protein
MLLISLEPISLERRACRGRDEAGPSRTARNAVTSTREGPLRLFDDIMSRIKLASLTSCRRVSASPSVRILLLRRLLLSVAATPLIWRGPLTNLNKSTVDALLGSPLQHNQSLSNNVCSSTHSSRPGWHWDLCCWYGCWYWYCCGGWCWYCCGGGAYCDTVTVSVGHRVRRSPCPSVTVGHRRRMVAPRAATRAFISSESLIVLQGMVTATREGLKEWLDGEFCQRGESRRAPSSLPEFYTDQPEKQPFPSNKLVTY